MSDEVDRAREVVATLAGSVASGTPLYAAAVTALAAYDEQAERIARLEATRDGLVEWRDTVTEPRVERLRAVALTVREPCPDCGSPNGDCNPDPEEWLHRSAVLQRIEGLLALAEEYIGREGNVTRTRMKWWGAALMELRGKVREMPGRALDTAEAPAPRAPSVPVAELRAVRDAAREVLAGLDGDGTLPCALCGREGEHSDGGDCNVLEIAIALCDTAEAKGGGDVTEWRGAEAEIAALRGPLSRERVVELRALLRRAVAHGKAAGLRQAATTCAVAAESRLSNMPTHRAAMQTALRSADKELRRQADAIERGEVDV